MLEKRYHDALRKIGAARLLTLPEDVKNVLKQTMDLETKVKMLELIADNIERGTS